MDPRFFLSVRPLWASLAGLIGLVSSPALEGAETKSVEAVREALTFHASFDQGIHAEFSRGDGTLHTCLQPNNQPDATAGLNAEGKTRHLKEGGLAGGALQFTARDAKWIFFPGLDNVVFNKENWAGTISVWLRLDPENDLDPGYTDPIQLTPRKWNDAAFFVDFDKGGDPRDFRLGAFADLGVWNPENKNVNEIPEDRRPLAMVSAPPFSRERWTHVLFTWERFNTGQKDGVSKLYLNGRLRGEIKGWEQTFSWSEAEEVRLFLGLNYIGLLDELSCFSRALGANEVKSLYALGGNIAQIIPER